MKSDKCHQVMSLQSASVGIEDNKSTSGEEVERSDFTRPL